MNLEKKKKKKKKQQNNRLGLLASPLKRQRCRRLCTNVSVAAAPNRSVVTEVKQSNNLSSLDDRPGETFPPACLAFPRPTVLYAAHLDEVKGHPPPAGKRLQYILRYFFFFFLQRLEVSALFSASSPLATRVQKAARRSGGEEKRDTRRLLGHARRAVPKRPGRPPLYR